MLWGRCALQGAVMNLREDVRFGLRMLAKNPGFTAVVLLTLSLGVGVNTALFSVVDAVLVNPLPFPNPDALVALYRSVPEYEKGVVSYPDFLDWQRQNHSFSAISAYRADDYTVTGEGEPEHVGVRMISAEFFSVLDLKAERGRNFRREEDNLSAAPVAILGDGYWKRRFGAREVVGRSIKLNGVSHTVVGVFRGRITGMQPVDLFVPIGQWKHETFWDRRYNLATYAIGRLKPGVTLEQARAEMKRIAANLEAAYPEIDKGAGITLFPLKSDIVGDVRMILLALLGAVCFVTLIACANVANLILVRAKDREGEFAIRAALGAGPGRIFWQLLTESMILGLTGGVLGLGLAFIGLRFIMAVMPGDLPRAEEIGIDGTVMLYTAGISLLTGLAFGMAPALRAMRPDLQGTLKEGGRGATRSRHGVQKVLVVLEVAVALVLLIGTGLMTRTLVSLSRINPGFDPQNLLKFEVSLNGNQGKDAEHLRDVYRELVRTLREIPGVEAGSEAASSLPMIATRSVPFWVEGQSKPASLEEMHFSYFYLVSAGYLKAMRIPLLRGRWFSELDDEQAPRVAVVDAQFAKKYFRGQDPVGKRLNIAMIEIQVEIVGVVGPVEPIDLGSTEYEQYKQEIYFPTVQMPDAFMKALGDDTYCVARTKGDPMTIGKSVRAAVQRLTSVSVVYGERPMSEVMRESISTQRFTVILLSTFSWLALVLASIGIYGVISYLARQRTREIGVRVALGATQSSVLRMILAQGMGMTIVGVIVGLGAAIGLTRLLRKMLYSVSETDPITLGAAAAILTGISLLACYIPARRAVRVDPVTALRYE